MLSPSSSKVVGLFLVASALGITVVGLARYNAKASEATPGITALASTTSKSKQINELYRFSMEMNNVQSRYRVFSFEIVSQNGKSKAVLSLQKRAGDSAVKTYRKDIDEETFVAFWQALRELEVAQLTNLSPYTENLSQTEPQTKSPTENESLYRSPGTLKSAGTYRFQFQDGLYDYPNSFEVYAPEAISDARYKALQGLTMLFVEEAFEEALETE